MSEREDTSLSGSALSLASVIQNEISSARPNPLKIDRLMTRLMYSVGQRCKAVEGHPMGCESKRCSGCDGRYSQIVSMINDAYVATGGYRDQAKLHVVGQGLLDWAITVEGFGSPEITSHSL